MEPIVTINSTSTPQINGDWLVNDHQIGLIMAQQLAILTKGTFTNGQTTLLWMDGRTGSRVMFPNTSLFTSWAFAYAEWATQASMASFKESSFPTNPVTIA